MKHVGNIHHNTRIYLRYQHDYIRHVDFNLVICKILRQHYYSSSPHLMCSLSWTRDITLSATLMYHSLWGNKCDGALWKYQMDRVVNMIKCSHTVWVCSIFSFSYIMPCCYPLPNIYCILYSKLGFKIRIHIENQWILIWLINIDSETYTMVKAWTTTSSCRFLIGTCFFRRSWWHLLY